MSENLKLIPEIEVGGKKYQFKTTRHLRVKYEEEINKLQGENKITEEQAMKVAKYNNLVSDLQEIAERFNNAKIDYFDNVVDKVKKETYLAYEELYKNKLNELENAKPEIQAMNDTMATTIDIYERLLIEAIIEQHSKSNEEAKAIWKDFVMEVGKATARDYLVAIFDELFNSEEVQEKGFLAQRQAKLQKQAEMRKQAIHKK